MGIIRRPKNDLILPMWWCRPQERQREVAEASLDARHRLRQKVMAGDVQGALREQNSNLRLFTGQLADRMVQLEVDFFSKCLAFVELIRCASPPNMVISTGSGCDARPVF
jgi:hypothetical protein